MLLLLLLLLLFSMGAELQHFASIAVIISFFTGESFLLMDDSNYWKFSPFCLRIDRDFGYLLKISNEWKRSIEKSTDDRLKKLKRIEWKNTKSGEYDIWGKKNRNTYDKNAVDSIYSVFLSFFRRKSPLVFFFDLLVKTVRHSITNIVAVLPPQQMSVGWMHGGWRVVKSRYATDEELLEEHIIYCTNHNYSRCIPPWLMYYYRSGNYNHTMMISFQPHLN